MRPHLPDVTLIAATSVALEPTLKALSASLDQVQFGRAVLFTHHPPIADVDPRIEWRSIRRLASRRDYSRFMLHELGQYIETGHALCVQWDGFVLDGRRWDPAFLDYDYIGAPWPHFGDVHNVGNGGFSLRSSRLLAATARLPFDGVQSEDVAISRIFRPLLEAGGIRFAPENVARRFAYERTKPSGREFGFHGAFNLLRHVSAPDALQLCRNLEPGVLARNERWELLKWAICHGRPRLAVILLKRLLSSSVAG